MRSDTFMISKDALEVIQAIDAIEERDPDMAPISALSEDLARDYYESTHAWMHPFGDVRRDDVGYYIAHADNPNAKMMKPGDHIQDVALNKQPYWVVASNGTWRVELTPIPPNPLLTGIGAGGARLTQRDIDVFSGKYERERVQAVVAHIEKNRGHSTDITDVQYILLGTVPTNFGPNGTQGGWYKASDIYANRGGRRGMSVREIIISDAHTLKQMGFRLSPDILKGDIEEEAWDSFMSNVVGYFDNWIELLPIDKDIFINSTLLYATHRGLLDDEWRKKVWTVDKPRQISERDSDPYNYAICTIPDEHIFEPQSDIQMRCAGRLMMAIASTPWPNEKHNLLETAKQFLHVGKSNWYVNEHLIRFAHDWLRNRDGIDMLEIATHLPDPTNRRYAYSYLATYRSPLLKKAVYKEKHPETLDAIAHAMLSNGYHVSRADIYYMLEHFADILNDDNAGIYAHHHAQEGLRSLLWYARRSGLDVERALEADKLYEERYRPRSGVQSNPSLAIDQRMEQLAEERQWMDYTRRYMLSALRRNAR